MKNFLEKIKIFNIWILVVIIGMILTCYGISNIMALERLEISDLIKIIVTFVLGFSCFITGLVYMQRKTLKNATNVDNNKNNKVDIMSKGPNVVVIGGGTGLNTVLKGLKKYTNNITAIVTVPKTDNELGNTENIKQSLEALSTNTNEMQKFMNYDIKQMNRTFGDLYLSVAQNLYGNFATSLEKNKNIFSITGNILPVTLDEMKVCVELEDGIVIGNKEEIVETTANKVTKINRVYINPTNCKTGPGVIEAIQKADAIILGPGSLYIDVIPNLLIRNVAKTLRESKAFKIYIPNIMTEPGITDDYDVSDHINAIYEHVGRKIVEYCVCDNGDIIPEFLRRYNKAGANLVEVDSQKLKGKGIKLIKADISHIDGDFIRHDSDELAKAIIDLICTELKFRDKQSEEQYLLLSSRLKAEKKKTKKVKPKTAKPKKEKTDRKESKFASKYSERIKSIQESEEIRKQNIKLYEKAKELTEKEEQEEKKKFIKETYENK